MRPLCLIGLALAFSLALESDLPAARACIPSGDQSSINTALKRAGSRAVLCPRAVFALHAPVKFTAPNQRIYTAGHPRDSTRALLKVSDRQLSKAVDGLNRPYRPDHRLDGVELANVRVDGARTKLGTDPRPRIAEQALIEMGGRAAGQRVEWVIAGDPRGGSTLRFTDYSLGDCSGAVVKNNDFGPAGQPGWPGMPEDQVAYADDITFQCTKSEVSSNTVTDATDGAIVIFGALGSTFSNNRVRAVNRAAFGGINMVDPDYGSDFSGVVVTGNTIESAPAPIRVAMGMGGLIWGCAEPDERLNVNRGATVTDNTLRGEHMGYGFALNGVSNWTFKGNRDESRHTGKPVDMCGQTPPAPKGFQMDSTHVTQSTIEGEFENAPMEGLIGLCDPGDLTNDGRIDAKDVKALTEMARGSPSRWELCRGDLDDNGTIDGRDVQALQGLIGR